MNQRDYSHRRTGLCMTEHDFGETYTFLELFLKTYTSHEEEVQIVLDAILAIYMLEYGRRNPVRALKALRNPRNAGRKPAIPDDAERTVKSLHCRGKSIRTIAEETGLSKSTVQRLLSRN